MADAQKTVDSTYDAIIIGAGISGINTAYRLQTQLPDLKYTILEARDALGGTWDLFRYPGIRSDSDLHTFGFPWRPWTDENAIADAASIRKYINETAAIHGIDQHVQFHKKLISANWSSEQQVWQLLVHADGERQVVNGRFLLMGTGYYDYYQPLVTVIPGLENFKGTVIHPQFWPKELDHSGKKVIIIGSGATAVTLLPNLVDTATHVTMLQRSPSYVLNRPTSDVMETFSRNWLPTTLSLLLIRWKNIIVPYLLFLWCRSYPATAKRFLRAETSRQLPSNIPHSPHFEPKYNPWEQRLCICPNGDFFTALHKGNSEIVTGQIETMTENSIVLKSGQKLDADIIITATGLKLQLAGGANISVDGESSNLPEKFIWKSAMIQNIPNLAFLIGYTNASWTLGADASALLICRLLIHMKKNSYTSMTPKVKAGENLISEPLLNLSSTYIRAAKDEMPKAGDKGPWRPRTGYMYDWFGAKWGWGVTDGLVFEKVST